MASVAVLEDNDLMRRYLADLLGHVGGHAVRTYAEPTALVDALAEQPAALVVLDIGLGATARLDGEPVDGVQVCRRLKAEADAPAVILLTAHAFEDDEARFLEQSGADGYEAKPIRDEDAFLARVAELAADR